VTQWREILSQNIRAILWWKLKSLSHLGLNWYRVATDTQTNRITLTNLCYNYELLCVKMSIGI